MPICLIVNASAPECRQTAESLTKTSSGIDTNEKHVSDAHGKSESEWEKGSAGEKFRDTASRVAGSAQTISGAAADVAKKLNAFADSIDTVRRRMLQASNIALKAKLTVDLGTGYPEWIYDPVKQQGPGLPISAQTEYAHQVDAYQQAYSMVGEARKIEIAAYQTLSKGVGDKGSVLSELAGNFAKDGPFTAAGAITGAIGESVKDHGKWTSIAAEYEGAVNALRTFAASGTGDASDASRAFLNLPSGAEGAATRAASSAGFTFGNPESKVAQWMAKDIEIVPKLGKFGSVPAVGVVLTGMEIVYDSKDADSVGDVAKVVGKDGGAFLAGSAATLVLMGPLGWGFLPAVAVGGLAGWGVGEGIGWATK